MPVILKQTVIYQNYPGEVVTVSGADVIDPVTCILDDDTALPPKPAVFYDGTAVSLDASFERVTASDYVASPAGRFARVSVSVIP